MSGSVIVSQLHTKPDFRHDMERARAELDRLTQDAVNEAQCAKS